MRARHASYPPQRANEEKKVNLHTARIRASVFAHPSVLQENTKPECRAAHAREVVFTSPSDPKEKKKKKSCEQLALGQMILPAATRPDKERRFCAICFSFWGL